MSDTPPEVTPVQRQARYEAALARIEAHIEALPERARIFARHYRPCIALCGRLGPDGSAVRLLEAFVSDLEEVVREKEN